MNSPGVFQQWSPGCSTFLMTSDPMGLATSRGQTVRSIRTRYVGSSASLCLAGFFLRNRGICDERNRKISTQKLPICSCLLMWAERKRSPRRTYIFLILQYPQKGNSRKLFFHKKESLDRSYGRSTLGSSGYKADSKSSVSSPATSHQQPL